MRDSRQESDSPERTFVIGQFDQCVKLPPRYEDIHFWGNSCLCVSLLFVWGAVLSEISGELAMKWFQEYVSNTLAGSGNQVIYFTKDDEIHRGRVYYKVFKGGR